MGKYHIVRPSVQQDKNRWRARAMRITGQVGDVQWQVIPGRNHGAIPKLSERDSAQ